MTNRPMNTVARWRRLARLYLGCTLLLPGAVAQAADITVTVKVTVVEPLPCVVNFNRTVEVDFGNDVVTTRVDGNNYLRPIPYSVQCGGQSSNAMTVQILGGAAGFGTGNVLSTNKADLGIALFISNGNQPLSLSSPIPFTYPTVPALHAVPVKRPGSTLTAGIFSAGATIKVDYQ